MDPDYTKPLQQMLAPEGEAKSADEIVQRLISYRQEADSSRKTGMNSRDDKWSENLDLYWNRWDFSKKKDWQSKQTMPEVPGFVDRFAGAMKDALMAGGANIYDIVDPGDTEQDLGTAVRGMTDIWLSQVGMSPQGTPLDFSAVFEDQVKLGAMMMMSASVGWKGDVPGGRVSIDTVDPRQVWLDNTGRNLYRVRRETIDRHELVRMAKATDSAKRPIWRLPGIEQLMGAMDQMTQQEQEQLQGTGQQTTSSRVPVTLDEYYATTLDENGQVSYDKSLCVVANDKYLVRGPEANPFWHGRDWLVATPLIQTPLSVYGRTYMEDFGQLAKTFNELTNLILDAVQFSSIRAFVMVPDMLTNPEQAMGGIWSGKTFQLEDGYSAKDFATALELGTLPAEALEMWQTLKRELTESAGINEVGLGQFAPKGRTTAQEIAQTAQSSSAIIKSVAQTVEKRWMDPIIDLVWKTGLQHMKVDNAQLRGAAGDDLYPVLWARRKELIQRPISFQARGISRLIQKNTQLHALMSVIQILASSDVLMQTFLQEVDLTKLVHLLFTLSDVDLSKLTLSAREKAIREAGMAQMQSMQQQAQAAPAAGPNASPGQKTVQSFARQLGYSNAKAALGV
jgi:hypothetical protein